MSACLEFSEQIVRQDYSSVYVQGSYGPWTCCRFQIKLIDEQWTVYVDACYRQRIKQILNLRRNVLTKCKSVMSYDSKKECSKHIRNPDECQLSVWIDPCSQLHNSPLRPPAHGWTIEKCSWYVMEIEENELDKEWWGRRAINIYN